MWEKVAFVLIGAGISWIFQQYRVAISEEIALINEHIKDLEKFCDAAQAYWLKVSTTKDEEVAAAAKVRATHAVTTFLYPDICRICDKEEFKVLSFKLFDVAMGSDFESANRKINPTLAIETYDAAARVIHLLRMSRRDVISLKRFCMWPFRYLSKLHRYFFV